MIPDYSTSKLIFVRILFRAFHLTPDWEHLRTIENLVTRMSGVTHVQSQLADRKWENAEFPIVCEGM
jgi:hypothetical protein